MDTLIATLPTDAPTRTDFPALFRTYLYNSVEQALHQVRAQPHLVQEGATRETVLHILSLALESPAVYTMVREIVQRLTPTMEQAGLWASWLTPLHRAIAQAQKQQDRRTEAEWRFWLGQLYQNRSEFAAAHTQWAASRRLFVALGDAPNQAKTLNRLAYLARLERRYAEGEALVTSALQLLSPTDSERAFSYFVQGVLAFDKADWPAAVSYLQASLTMSEQQGDKVTIARRLRNLGPALRAMGRYVEAIACYERAIALFGEVYDPVQQAATRMNLGVVYLQTDQPALALHQFATAEPIFRDTQDRWHLAQLYTNQGIAYRLLQEWQAAAHAYEASIALCQKLGNLEGEVNAWEELGLVHLAQGQLHQAITIFEQALALLTQMQEDPAYAALAQSITEHLRQAQATVTDATTG